tara:strand:+ start:267 stop:701 length:435 start_codon:yes stop_codon:yes gene_type:complete
MDHIKSGMIAGFAATVVLSVMMIMKTAVGIMPELDVIHMIAGMLGASVFAGWVAHFVLGTVVWGGGFAVLNDAIPCQGQIAKGIAFGVAAWLLMMIAVMPMAGAGFFGLNMGIAAPVMTLMLHIVFGAVLGWVYMKQTQKSALA